MIKTCLGTFYNFFSKISQYIEKFSNIEKKKKRFETKTINTSHQNINY